MEENKSSRDGWYQGSTGEYDGAWVWNGTV